MKEDMLKMLRGNVGDRVIEAMERVPRELFVPESIRSLAYEDHPLPIGEGQTISAPHMVAIMCDVLDLGEGMSALDVGAGSGYHAAVMAELVGPEGCVYSIERVPELVVFARRNLREAGIKNVTVVEGDGSRGLPEHAPYDRINVAATAPEVPEPLKEQLKVGGKLVVPVGSCYQELVLVIRTEEGFELEHHGGVVFVPLIGDHGFKI
ncbi:MAG: protein-L-isoaspartate(D-aspartate) O-methyltransferase [Methanothrix sp.]|jgi:protein-L-isoaspartate(D-aspartate) O-methyltransferase|uniref:Protein-L-isoaspartate O-methyltransferase n=1 Tax=Methanothrix harundinacea TaxID=301375 RepID=A0A117MBT8_9EURY|nr:MAG: protein-L-isoaspartate O-methyltransferase [Methanosaeta sp. SDB]KUK44092.1 MAG: Protein-L-isoaspartate O-methyltransferase [Methanothrix harundinacea]MDD2638622.1 protein-L-isoaspartate(D-aspartate) O-methyltransferase [Methanothrix sp.]MDI9398359.1 protein-L-isoaspartate(D-aspartate) O-methyltransferase [Euryarchaeota archaeon]KUK95364.1 MAG: Protein-L-isoaspartate O-methyltransferase [Methanothrix harundinacea]